MQKFEGKKRFIFEFTFVYTAYNVYLSTISEIGSRMHFIE